METALLLHLALALPLVGITTWSWLRYSAPLLLEVLDDDEVLAAAVLRLTTVAHALIGLGVAALAAPDRPRAGLLAGAIGSAATVAFWLGLLHGLVVAALVRARYRRQQRVLAPSPGVWVPPVPPPPLAWTAPPPLAWTAPPPLGPPFCVRPQPRRTDPPLSFDPWTAPPWDRPVGRR